MSHLRVLRNSVFRHRYGVRVLQHARRAGWRRPTLPVPPWYLKAWWRVRLLWLFPIAVLVRYIQRARYALYRRRSNNVKRILADIKSTPPLGDVREIIG